MYSIMAGAYVHISADNVSLVQSVINETILQISSDVVLNNSDEIVLASAKFRV